MTQKGFQGIDRDTYKDVKKMDREKMTKFLANIYFMGQDDLKEELMEKSTNTDLDGLKNELSSIKGIGEKRLNEIMDVIKRYV